MNTKRRSKVDPDRLFGRVYEVQLNYAVEYRMRVAAGVEQQSAIEEADLRRFADGVDPTDRMLVHTEVEAVEPIYGDDPRACDVADWIDTPNAPSEDTYWDDSRHFGGGEDGD